MSEFEAQQPNFRLAETYRGDTLQDVAAREMGDANRWPELIWLNRLVPPYLTDDPSAVSATVLLTGSLIRVPAPVGMVSEDADAGQVYERDCLLTNKRLSVDSSGDFAVASGAQNFKQQLSHRVVTPRGQAKRHPEYGCLVWQLFGRKNDPALSMLGHEYVRATLAADYRVSDVQRAQATVSGDAIRVSATALGITGASVDLQN